MMSRRVSRFTLKGMFLMTIAVGIISSSADRLGVVGGMPEFSMCPIVGEPPEEERSELFGGDRERLSGMPMEGELSSHC